ncbi:MAG: phosphoribosylformylglycinamidine cyclo-ligase [Cyanobacteria bacterium]|nr:phosphoribosylformylglycinamidine cyclo-ligase [Cyanobacteriota bacterium]MDW8202387.1 phosphoribosylformylglycinamidine cyclo-ligase [Cyanobacteriota bacterium SKYGB_h_bin112]
MDYRQAGVDIEAGRDFVRRIQTLVEGTYRPGVLGKLGGFSGLFELPTGYQHPVLVSGTDGVGTKLKLAQSQNVHSTIGIDLVAMCVNDVLTCGAEPLFFLDYLATSQLQPEVLTQVVAGISQGCCQAGCALLGGETAEMPGFYQPGEYDLAGFCVGVVEKANILDGSRVQVGDRVIGLASQGVHSNGFSLVRKILCHLAATELGGDRSEVDLLRHALDYCPPELEGQRLGHLLMTPTQIYVQPVRAIQQANLPIHGMAHITGGGLPENLPRCLGHGQALRLDPNSWQQPPIFNWLATQGDVAIAEMFTTFNMGIGFALIVPTDYTDDVLTVLQDNAVTAWEIGEVIAGEGSVVGIPST